MTYPLVQFVDAPTPTATVLFDFNDKTATVRRYTKRESFSVGAPDLDGDVDSVDPRYLPRTVAFTLMIDGPKSAALTVQSQLARRITAGPGWLRFQMSASSKVVYFRTYRAQPGDLSFDNASADTGSDIWELAITLPAESFARGERVTLSTVTINNDPAAGTNPCSVALASIVGDAPAPLRLAVVPSNRSTVNGRRWLFAAHAGATSRAPIFWQIGTGDGWTGFSVAAPVSSASYSGGSYRPTSFSGTPGAASGFFNGNTPTTPTPGRYKVMIRAARSDLASTFTVQFQQSGALSVTGVAAAFDRASSGAVEHATWLDLGDFTFPPATPDGIDTAVTAFDPFPVAVNIKRLTGGGQLFLDVIALIPISTPDTVESRFMYADAPTAATTSDTALDIYDGDLEVYWKANGSTLAQSAGATIQGAFPRVTPGAANTLTVLQQVAQRSTGGDNSDAIAATTSVTPSYLPRYLYVGDS